eukprot:gene10674-19425_t
MFQTAEPMLHHLRSAVLKLLKNILPDFIRFDTVRRKDPLTTDIDFPESRVPVDKIYMGVNATITLSDCNDPEAAIKVKRTCLGFMIELVKQIRARFQINDPIFKASEIRLAINASKCNPPSLLEVYRAMPYIENIADIQAADLEWRQQALEEQSEVDADDTISCFGSKD